MYVNDIISVFKRIIEELHWYTYKIINYIENLVIKGQDIFSNIKIIKMSHFDVKDV